MQPPRVDVSIVTVSHGHWADLREALPVTPPSPPPGSEKKSGPSPLTLVLGLLSGELGSPFEGPRVGQPAPDFCLKTEDGKAIFMKLAEKADVIVENFR